MKKKNKIEEIIIGLRVGDYNAEFLYPYIDETIGKDLLIERLKTELEHQEEISKEFIDYMDTKKHCFEQKSLYVPRFSDYFDLSIEAELSYISLVRERINNLIKYVEKCIELSNEKLVVTTNNIPSEVVIDWATGEVTKIRYGK